MFTNLYSCDPGTGDEGGYRIPCSFNGYTGVQKSPIPRPPPQQSGIRITFPHVKKIGTICMIKSNVIKQEVRF